MKRWIVVNPALRTARIFDSEEEATKAVRLLVYEPNVKDFIGFGGEEWLIDNCQKSYLCEEGKVGVILGFDGGDRAEFTTSYDGGEPERYGDDDVTYFLTAGQPVGAEVRGIDGEVEVQGLMT